MSPGKMSTSLASTADSSTFAAISSATDADDGNLTKDETNFEMSENIRKSINGTDTILVGIGNGEKNENALRGKSNEERIKQESNEEQLLGSLTSMSSPAVRTSARVIQKMKMDSIRPTTPPPHDKKDAAKDESHSRNSQKTPNQTRPTKTIWAQVERNLFFDALNEFGKDFESIAQFINSKQKRKNSTDPTYKAKEHVRLLYYQTFTKISKYLRFSDDVTKKVQELYALINYGEMRRKVQLDNQKLFMKLRELVYRGSVTVRVKGKNCRIKTPSCPALRKINQVEKGQEDIKLPSKVDVEMKPANNDSWYYVQSLAQNPRIKTSLPLQKRLISLIKTLQVKWRSRESKLFEQNVSKNPVASTATGSNAIIGNSNGTSSSCSSSTSKLTVDSMFGVESAVASTISSLVPLPYTEPVLCITPPVDATIYRPYVNLTDFLTSSNNICLNSYEERIEASVRGESLCAEHITNFKEMIKSNAKRQRHDSGSEKKSPDAKRTRNNELDAKTSTDSETTTPLKKMSASVSQDGMSSTSADESVGVNEDKYERDFASPTQDSVLFEMDGISHLIDASSADEGDRDEPPPMNDSIKIESNVDGGAATGSVIKKESIDSASTLASYGEPVIIVPDCIKRNLSVHNRGGKRNEGRGQLNNLNSGNSKKRDMRNRDQHRDSYRPLINAEVTQKIRKGWTLDDVGDITIGDLYLMFGQDSRVRLEYRWITPTAHDPTKTVDNYDDIKSEPLHSSGEMVSVKSENIAEANKPKNALSNKLKQLLLLASMNEKTKKRTNCACGHYCDRSLNKAKKEEVFPRSFISNKTYPSSHTDKNLFRQPVLPSRTGISHYEPYRLNLNNSRSKQNRWLKNRNNRTSKQVVVQRLLPLQPGMTQSYGVLSASAASDVKYNGIEMVSKFMATSADNADSTHGMENVESISRYDCKPSTSRTATAISSDMHMSAVDMPQLLQIESECDDGPDETDSIESEKCDRSSSELDDDPGIQSLMEISLPSPIPIAPSSDEYFNEDNVSSQPPMSPMGILRESPSPNDAKWFEENMHDFSLSSFLGHLDAACDQNAAVAAAASAAVARRCRSPNRCTDSSNLSTISESSIDYISKFEELAESMKNEANNILMQ